MKRRLWATSTLRRTCAPNGHLIGGEQSGHIIFGKYANTGDGLLTAIKLMQVMLDRKQPLSELAAPVTRCIRSVLTNVEVDDKDATLNDPAVVAAAQTVDERLRRRGTHPRCARAARSRCCASWSRRPRTQLCEENVDVCDRRHAKRAAT